MKTVGAYEAKTHLPQLLDQAAKGEKIMITKHGHPIAILQSVEPQANLPIQEVIQQLKQFRKKQRINGLSIKAMIDEGRD